MWKVVWCCIVEGRTVVYVSLCIMSIEENGFWLYPPLGHYLVGIREVAVYIFHLEGVGIADLVICAPVISALDHDDITSWTA